MLSNGDFCSVVVMIVKGSGFALKQLDILKDLFIAVVLKSEQSSRSGISVEWHLDCTFISIPPASHLLPTARPREETTSL